MSDILGDLLVSIPESTANLQLPDPALRQFYKDEQDRIFWVDSQIDENTLDLVKMIIQCNREDKGIPIHTRKPITIMIDSPGGSVDVLLAVIKAIDISKTPVRTVCYCNAYSAAADLLASGHKGLRYCMPGTNVMMHAGSCAYQGTASQVDAAKKFYDSMGKKVTDHVYARTNIDTKTQRKMKEDYYMTDEDALKLGIVDKIIDNLDELF